MVEPTAEAVLLLEAILAIRDQGVIQDQADQFARQEVETGAAVLCALQEVVAEVVVQ